MTTDGPATYGVVLAGGLSRRMGGGDKPLIKIDGSTILARVLATLGAQCVGLVINANGDPTRFSAYGTPVVPDDVPGFVGPLAGILAGLDFVARHAPQIEWMVSSPGDCPFLPTDLVARLHVARQTQQRTMACAQSGTFRHPVAGLWPVACRQALRAALTEEGLRKIEVFTGRHGVALAQWPTEPIDPFFNVNTPEDAVHAQTMARRGTAT
jgi:molybdenum cofactor guanylyltransferase